MQRPWSISSEVFEELHQCEWFIRNMGAQGWSLFLTLGTPYKGIWSSFRRWKEASQRRVYFSQVINVTQELARWVLLPKIYPTSLLEFPNHVWIHPLGPCCEYSMYSTNVISRKLNFCPYLSPKLIILSRAGVVFLFFKICYIVHFLLIGLIIKDYIHYF